MIAKILLGLVCISPCFSKNLRTFMWSYSSSNLFCTCLDIVIFTSLQDLVKASSSSIVVRTMATHIINKTADLTPKTGLVQNIFSAPLEIRWPFQMPNGLQVTSYNPSSKEKEDVRMNDGSRGTCQKPDFKYNLKNMINWWMGRRMSLGCGYGKELWMVWMLRRW